MWPRGARKDPALNLRKLAKSADIIYDLPKGMNTSNGTSRRIRLNPFGFTLIELLVSITVLSILMLFMTSVVGVVQSTWTKSNSKVSQFREARMAMDVLTRNLSQATLNTYWDTSDTKTYQRQSELQFVCGKTTGLINRASAGIYPTHGVFFQAPLGTTIQSEAKDADIKSGARVDTENMTNLLCGRGYFIQLDDDAAFRPPFLDDTTVPKHTRYRLMEYSPPAELNQIYAAAYKPLVPIVANNSVSPPIAAEAGHSKAWFTNDVAEIEENETAANRGRTRPVAENVIALVISPQVDTRSDTTVDPSWIAPQYEFDTTLKQNPGAPAPTAATGLQGTQNILPPLLKITMVVIDPPAAEKLARDEVLRSELTDTMKVLFVDAAKYSTEDSQYNKDLLTLTTFLTGKKLNHRVFTNTVVMKQARWSL